MEKSAFSEQPNPYYRHERGQDAVTHFYHWEWLA
ncbi:hypothetical protein SAMN05421819_1190 [Bryocella elongata]|uniref:Uncharacterized protein n=1 Tax=Bryocella elongata TaxID=863522 RepID=A0A1H5UTG8_9BACT|nr:hypothetical protein SAMN05421819_1190 [Bryocella elongata]